MRSQNESNAVNRILKAWGFGSLGDSAAVPAMARMVQDHEHFGEILRACEPALRRDMYEAMSPNLRFKARNLEWYEIGAKEHAEAMQYPTMTADGGLKPYMPPSIGNIVAIDMPEFELWLQCHKCKKESFYYADRKADAIAGARDAGWSWDELESHHLCPNCLDAYEQP